ncbi:TetR/AcrR family transcriptional regulator [Paenibacillus sp. HJGM_3]|uniref:TetR/AcrR family transcriptional regulator n=1 Tax=Paenibacillus sp. HJGM_3 TaxID=3379816 RepID=UPI00385D4A87
METVKRETAKERILRVASALFYQEGIRAVGIDRIIQESGVAKASFYRNFATKDDLIVAYLEQKQSASMASLEEGRRLYPHAPVKQLMYAIDRLVERMSSPGYRGCAFMNTAVEFPECGHPGHAAAVEGRNFLWRRIEEIARDAGAHNPEELAQQLRMLVSGAMMVAYMSRESFNPGYFAQAARTLVDNQLAMMD